MRVGVFDSGLGGLTIVKAMMHHIRGAQIVYVADTLNAPYGEKTHEQIQNFSIRVTEYLLRHHDIEVLVVACNTATSAAIALLRERYPELIVVGTEPGLKPAISHSHTKKVGVLATPATLGGEKYKALLELLCRHYHVEVFEQPCPGLVDAIENGETASPRTVEMMEGWLGPIRDAGVDTIVLGCTHYPLVGETIEKVMGHPVTLVQTADAVSKRVLDLMVQKGHINEGDSVLQILSTGPIRSDMVERIMGESFNLTMIHLAD